MIGVGGEGGGEVRTEVGDCVGHGALEGDREGAGGEVHLGLAVRLLEFNRSASVGQYLTRDMLFVRHRINNDRFVSI